eukprot:TRINITY_DN1206_c0_g1_i4.p1 TRINITY_DN1206_c0_g1~~TRINITY_DN1206_c0_g1_i4.p1  ORF type:complete len:273 (-),score=5.90 TRINITY_DN1206_c0_g1_i4:154-972(-)
MRFQRYWQQCLKAVLFGMFQGKVAVVTGGDSGIGRSVCYHFALEGATVAFTYVSPAELIDASETFEKLRSFPSVSAHGHMMIPVSDLGDPDVCKKVVDEVAGALGRIDVLVNCAAEQRPVADIEQMEPAQMERTFKTNFFSQFYMARFAIKHMGKGGTIINTISRQAYIGNAENLDYAATKGAILSFTRSLALQLAKRQIRVNGVAPGPIWTPLNAAALSVERVVHLGEDTPMGRAGQPSEVGPCYVFLASRDSSYITGQNIHPNGGHAMYS